MNDSTVMELHTGGNGTLRIWQSPVAGWCWATPNGSEGSNEPSIDAAVYNAHEAEAFMAAAQRLATMTSIDLAVARAHAASRTAAQVPTQRTINIGEPGSRGLRTYVQLFAAIAAAWA